MATVTITIASPAVVSWAAHGRSAGNGVVFSTADFMPTGVIPGVLYYVLSTGLTSSEFQFALSAGGAAINTTGSQAGVITGTAATKHTFSPVVAPSPDTSTNYELKLKKAGFGDGYSQTTRDGLNHQRQVVTLKWDVLKAEWASDIEKFFVQMGGDTGFLYTLSGDVARQWTCETYNRSRSTPNKISATFRQDFNL